MKKTAFPLYRKYRHKKTYFKIQALDSFEQLDIFNRKYLLHEYTAKIYPDKVFIEDMMRNTSDLWEEISEEEYFVILNYCRENLKLIA